MGYRLYKAVTWDFSFVIKSKNNAGKNEENNKRERYFEKEKSWNDMIFLLDNKNKEYLFIIKPRNVIDLYLEMG